MPRAKREKKNSRCVVNRCNFDCCFCNETAYVLTYWNCFRLCSKRSTCVRKSSQRRTSPQRFKKRCAREREKKRKQLQAARLRFTSRLVLPSLFSFFFMNPCHSMGMIFYAKQTLTTFFFLFFCYSARTRRRSNCMPSSRTCRKQESCPSLWRKRERKTPAKTTDGCLRNAKNKWKQNFCLELFCINTLLVDAIRRHSCFCSRCDKQPSIS